MDISRIPVGDNAPHEVQMVEADALGRSERGTDLIRAGIERAKRAG